MRFRAMLGALAPAVPILLAAAAPAQAKCHRFTYVVNDFGKEGPSKDAEGLLDQYIVNWAAEHGIKKYTVSKQQVACELFLNLIVFGRQRVLEWPSAWINEASRSRDPTTAAKPARSTAPEVSSAVADSR